MKYLVIIFTLISASCFANFDTSKVNDLNNRAWEIRNQNTDSSLILAEQAYSISNQLDYSKGLIKSLITIGSTYLLKEQLDSAESYFMRALDRSSIKHYYQGIAAIENNLGLVYRRKGLYLQSLKHFQKSLNVKKMMDSDQCSIIISNANIAGLYIRLEEFDKARLLLSNSLERAYKLDCNHIETLKLHLGVCYYKLHYPDSALKVFESIDKFPSTTFKSIAFNNIGLCYYKKKQFLTAIAYYRKALEINQDSIPSANGMTINLINIGKSQLGLERYEEAEESFNFALNIIEKNSFRNKSKVDLLEDFAELYELTYKWDLAYKYLQESSLLQDSLRNKELDELQNSYHSTLMIYENEQLLKSERIALKIEKSKKESAYLIAFLSSALALSTITLLIILFKKNRLISEQKNKLVITNEQLIKNTELIERQKSELQETNYELSSLWEKLQQSSLDLSIQLRKSSLTADEEKTIDGRKSLDKLKNVFWKSITYVSPKKNYENTQEFHSVDGTTYTKLISLKKLFSLYKGELMAPVKNGHLINLLYVKKVNFSKSEVLVKIHVWNKAKTKLLETEKSFEIPKRGKYRLEFNKRYHRFIHFYG